MRTVYVTYSNTLTLGIGAVQKKTASRLLCQKVDGARSLAQASSENPGYPPHRHTYTHTLHPQLTTREVSRLAFTVTTAVAIFSPEIFYYSVRLISCHL